MMVSVFYLDLGGRYSFEANATSVISNSSSILGLFYISSFCIFILIFSRSLDKNIISRSLFKSLNFRRKKWLTPNQIKIYLLFSIGFIAILYVHLIYSGIPILLGYGKGQFWTYAKIPFFNILHNQTTTLMFISGFMFSYSYQYNRGVKSFLSLKKWFRLNLVLYLIYIVLMGYKFGGPLLYLFSFFITTLVIQAVTNGFKIRKIIKYFILFSSFVIPVILYVYNVILKFGERSTELLFDRIFTLQGQVWHFIYTQLNNGDIKSNSSQINNEISNLFGLSSPENSGMNYLMQFILPDVRLESYLEGGVRLSGGYPANLLIIFDNYIVIILLHILMTVIIGLLHLGLFKSLIKFQFVRSLIWFKLAFLSEGYLFMGDLNTVFSIKSIFYILILMSIYLLKYNEYKRAIK